MNLTVRGHNVEITDGLRKHAEDKLARLNKYFDNIQEIRVELNYRDVKDENKRHVAQVTCFVSGSIIRAEVASRDMYASLDLVHDKLETQLTKYKEKIKTKKKEKVVTGKTLMQESTPDIPRPKVSIRRKRFAIKPMSMEEAVLQMEMLHHSFFLFRNEDTDETNVIYQREEGNYGVIEPE